MGNSRSANTFNITSPTIPVAPTTATFMHSKFEQTKVVYLPKFTSFLFHNSKKQQIVTNKTTAVLLAMQHDGF